MPCYSKRIEMCLNISILTNNCRIVFERLLSVLKHSPLAIGTHDKAAMGACHVCFLRLNLRAERLSEPLALLML